MHDPGTTGNFEVTVAGKLVHSKTTMGHDKCENATSTQKATPPAEPKACSIEDPECEACQ